jgi:uncharacterized membrane protein YhaH (DUF805 family)
MTLLQIAADAEIATSGLDAVLKMASKISWRLLIDISSVIILIRFIYYPIYKHRDLFFTFFIFNLIIFLISFLLNKVELSMGAAFGLFAVFSMLRYRTEDISIKDMTYLFLVIALGLVSAVIKVKNADDIFENMFLIFINGIVLLITYLLESSILMRKETMKQLTYENIELIKPERREDLIADLKTRTGINIHRLSIHKIDFLKDSAVIKIYYYE